MTLKASKDHLKVVKILKRAKFRKSKESAIEELGAVATVWQSVMRQGGQKNRKNAPKSL